MGRLVLYSLLITGILLGGEITLKKPPESLRNYYPPKSEKFEFINNMHTMSTSFYGVQLNINDDNWDKAIYWAEKLVETYKKTAKMVPEKKKYFDFKKAETYLNAVRSKDVDKVVKAAEELGKTCAKCHQDNEIAVKIYYRFPDFSNLKVEDPVDFTEYRFEKFMEKLAHSLQALNVYLTQNQPDKVQEHGMNFVERARAVKETCSKCHTNKRDVEAITGKDYDELLNKLENILSSEKPNLKEVAKLTQRVGLTCYTCHNVHYIPAKIKSFLSK